MLPEPPKLLLGLFSDQQIPVVGSRVLPPGQGADVADGAAARTAEANIVLHRVANKSSGALVLINMSWSPLRGDLGLLVDDLGRVDHHILLSLGSLGVELQHEQAVVAGDDHGLLGDHARFAVVGVGAR